MSLTKVMIFITTVTLSHSAIASCPVDNNANVFTWKPILNTDAPVNWTTDISEHQVVAGSAASLVTYPWTPDGHITFTPEDGQWTLYFPNSSSFRATASNPDPEQVILNPTTPILGGRNPNNINHPDSGGSWLMSVFNVGGNNRIGLLHNEDHYFELGDPNNYIAHKSMAIRCSTDSGITWTNQETVLQSENKNSQTPLWTGLGDGHMVWDWQNSQWMAFFQNGTQSENNKISAAINKSKDASVEGWKKWDSSNFTVNGLSGYGAPLGNSFEGANPSVSWNTYLNKWVMVYGSWEGQIMISYADTLPHFSTPKVLISGLSFEGISADKLWYPTLASEVTGSEVTGQENKLYYRFKYMENGMDKSHFMVVNVNFSEAVAEPSSGSSFGIFSLLILSFMGLGKKLYQIKNS